jgi:hypothetical protein
MVIHSHGRIWHYTTYLMLTQRFPLPSVMPPETPTGVKNLPKSRGFRAATIFMKQLVIGLSAKRKARQTTADQRQVI